MVRAFARKSERHGKNLSGKDEPGSVDGSTSNEVSPASLWGLDDENNFRGNEDEAPTSENVSQSTPVNTAGREEERPVESLDPEPLPPYRDESDWWAQPNLMEDLPTNSPTIEQADVPSTAMSSSDLEESYSKVEEQPDEDTLITEPLAEAEDPSQAMSAGDFEESYSEIDDEDTLITKTVAESAASAAVTDEAQAEVEWSNQPESISEELAPLPNEAIEPLPTRLEQPSVAASETPVEPLRLVPEVKRPKPRLLDETSVLPSEASYATVPMNQEIKPRRRVLDESTVLPHEASFATVPLYEPSKRSYSPGKEFVSKAAFGVQRSLPIILLVAVCAGVIVFSLKYKSRLFDSADEKQVSRPAAVTPPVRSTARTEVPTTQANPVTVSSTQETVQPEKLHVPPVNAATLPLQKPPAVTTANPVKPVAADKTRQETAKTTVTKRKAESEKIASDAATTPSVTRNDTATPAEETPKTTADDSKNPASGGGERPRRVKPQGDPQANGTSQPKPKVIDWP